MTRHGSHEASALASIAIGASAAALLHAFGRTALGNPHRTLGLVVLILQLPGGVIAHALVGGPGFRTQPAEVPILLAVNALAYTLVAYGVLWSIERRRAARTRRPTPVT